MGLGATAVRSSIRYEQADTDGRGIPSQVQPDPQREAALSVKRAKQLSDVDDLRLELDHEQGSPLRRPGKKVDDATLAPDRERHLGANRPAEVAKPGGNDLGKLGVAGVDQPVEVAATPSDRLLEPYFERGRYRPERGHRQPADIAALHARYRGRGDARQASHVSLPQAAPDPDRADPRTEPEVVHARESGSRRFTCTYKRTPVLYHVNPRRA